MDRLEAKENLKKNSAAYFHQNFKYYLQKLKYLKFIKSKEKKDYAEVARRKEKLTKALYNKITMKKKFRTFLQ